MTTLSFSPTIHGNERVLIKPHFISNNPFIDCRAFYPNDCMLNCVSSCICDIDTIPPPNVINIIAHPKNNILSFVYKYVKFLDLRNSTLTEPLPQFQQLNHLNLSDCFLNNEFDIKIKTLKELIILNKNKQNTLFTIVCPLNILLLKNVKINNLTISDNLKQLTLLNVDFENDEDIENLMDKSDLVEQLEIEDQFQGGFPQWLNVDNENKKIIKLYLKSQYVPDNSEERYIELLQEEEWTSLKYLKLDNLVKFHTSSWNKSFKSKYPNLLSLDLSDCKVKPWFPIKIPLFICNENQIEYTTCVALWIKYQITNLLNITMYINSNNIKYLKIDEPLSISFDSMYQLQYCDVNIQNNNVYLPSLKSMKLLILRGTPSNVMIDDSYIENINIVVFFIDCIVKNSEMYNCILDQQLKEEYTDNSKIVYEKYKSQGYLSIFDMVDSKIFETNELPTLPNKEECLYRNLKIIKEPNALYATSIMKAEKVVEYFKRQLSCIELREREKVRYERWKMMRKQNNKNNFARHDKLALQYTLVPKHFRFEIDTNIDALYERVLIAFSNRLMNENLTLFSKGDLLNKIVSLTNKEVCIINKDVKKDLNVFKNIEYFDLLYHFNLTTLTILGTNKQRCKIDLDNNFLSLKHLEIKYCDIETIDHLINLEVLIANKCSLLSVPRSSMLKEVNIDRCIGGNMGIYIDLTLMFNLKILSMIKTLLHERSNLTSSNVESFSYDNPNDEVIEYGFIDFQNYPNLKHLYLIDLNAYNYFNKNVVNKLWSLSVDFLTLNNCEIVSLGECDLKKLELIGCKNMSIPKGLNTLTLRDCGLKDEDIECNGLLYFEIVNCPNITLKCIEKMGYLKSLKIDDKIIK